MNVLIILSASVAVLFLLAYMSKRRFGVLGLALAAGYVLSKIWGDQFSQIVALSGVSFDFIAPVTVVGLAVILLPSILLLFGGPTYKTKRGRLIGSILYALLAVVFSLGTFEQSLVLIGESRQIFATLLLYENYIMTIALILAIVDIMYARTGSQKAEKHSGKH